MGENEFKGVQIYDVIQNQKSHFLFATNEGLYYFDYYHYQKIECDNAKGNSFFGFVINNAGTIYCHNLNSQIFEIKNKEIKLFYELKSDENTSDVSLSITNDDNLLIGCKKIVILNTSGKKIKEYNFGNHYLGPAFITKNNKIQFSLLKSDSIIQYSKGVFTKNKLNFLTGDSILRSVFKFYTVQSCEYALDLKSKIQYLYNSTNFELSALPKNKLFEKSESIRVYGTEIGLWITGTFPGIAFVDKKSITENPSIYYQDYFISDVYKDHEGNMLLSTFDKGILVIPNINVPDAIFPSKDNTITSLHSDSVIGLVLGTSKGDLLKYINNKFTPINQNGKRPIEVIQGDEKSNFFIFDNGHIRVFDKRNNVITDIIEASLKDAVIVSENKFYLGTNRGVFLFEKNIANFNIKLLKGVSHRIYSLEYNLEDSCLYASTTNGLFLILKDTIINQILHNNTVIYPNYLHYYDGCIYVSTKKNGVLVVKNGKIKRTIYPIINDSKDIAFQKIIIYKGTIIAKTTNGLFQFDMNGKLLKAIHATWGFTSKKIIDFTIHQNKLFVSHTGGLQAIDLNFSGFENKKPIIQIADVLVNGESVNATNSMQLNNKQRNITFVLLSPTLNNHQSIRYYYKLVGADLKWNTNSFESNTISYAALAPGKYTFYAKAENQGVFSKTLTYSFFIPSPFYTHWLFISLVIVVFLAVVFFIYKWKLGIQQKKAKQINELNASKLTAIQSQMNPHFIFNSLNSIQDLILKGDVEHSYSYITTFSNLVRRTLSYSEKDFIDFDQEIKLLELYLSLEKLRFKKDFNYVINTNNIDDIMLPPLLIQPFIENSLLHGLLHKESSKNLIISFELNEVLVCIIEDNGIGRDKAKTIKLRQRPEHESFSGKAIDNRFKILSNILDGKFGYKYEDLYKNNDAIGTRVILTIPFKHKF